MNNTLIGECKTCKIKIVEYPATMNYGGLPDPAEPNVPYDIIDGDIYCETCKEVRECLEEVKEPSKLEKENTKWLKDFGIKKPKEEEVR